MPEETISVVDLASQCGKRKQTVFKVLRRLRIEPRKLRSSDRRAANSSPFLSRWAQLSV